MRAKLRLYALELPVFIGLTSEERSRSQLIEFNLEIFYKEAPQACLSDEIMDVACYDDLAGLIENFVSGKKFKLIEKLCFDLMEALKVHVKEASKIVLEVKKLQPPLRQKNQGAGFSLTWKLRTENRSS
jgi:FolB domain-containing protein